jgi:uncharacterized protein YceH (UPF0502 family)
VNLTAPEIRVLGCLVEKQRTTPEQYPLTLNALRLACNQSTNRDPVVDYDEPTVRDAAQRLGRRGLSRFASGHGSRAAKYRHLLKEELGLGPGALSFLTVLMLRGPQTPGELRARSDRLHSFAGAEEASGAIDELVERGLARRLERRPGEREARYVHLLGEEDVEAPVAAVASDPSPEPEPEEPSLAERVERLEREIAEIRARLDT